MKKSNKKNQDKNIPPRSWKSKASPLGAKPRFLNSRHIGFDFCLARARFQLNSIEKIMIFSFNQPPLQGFMSFSFTSP